MANIKSIKAYEIIDSRGFPTIEGRLTLDNGQHVTSSVPAGTSIGKFESVELRDRDPNRFDGMGVSQAVHYINDLLAPKLIGLSPLKQQEVDYWLIKADNTPNKSKLGANTTLVISELVAKAAAIDQGIPLFMYITKLYETLFKSTLKIDRIPSPIFNIINGAKHANNNLEFQEFQIIPSTQFSFSKAYQTGVEIFHELQRVLTYRNANISVGEEGGFSPNLSTNLDALELLHESLIQKNLKSGVDVFFGLDIAASYFYKNGKYVIKDKPHPLNREEYIDFVLHIIETYSLLTLEDPLVEDDWEGWNILSAKLADKLYLIGDDILVTNKARLLRAIKEKTCSAILVKPNQNGTVTETLEVVDVAKKNKINVVISHRSGETNDSFIADFAVGLQVDFVKFGAPSRGERVAKYNRLWQIERDELRQT